MVHALEKVHRLLIRGGLLIEVHDEPVSPSFALEFEDETVDAGLLQDSAKFQEVRQANQALDQVINTYLFERLDFQIMPYQIHIDSLDSYAEWRERQWDTTYVESTVETYIRQSMSGTASRLIVSRVAQVTILKSL